MLCYLPFEQIGDKKFIHSSFIQSPSDGNGKENFTGPIFDVQLQFRATQTGVADSTASNRSAELTASLQQARSSKCTSLACRDTRSSPRRAEKTDASLTGGVGADVDDVALGPVHLVLVGRRQLGLHHDGVPRPRLERQDEVTGFELLLVALGGSPRGVHICYHPAVGAAGVLPVKLGDIAERSVVESKGGCGGGGEKKRTQK